MSIQLNSVNGSVTLVPEDGTGNVDVTVPRNGFIVQAVGKTITTQGSQTITINTDTVVGVAGDFSLSITPKLSGSRFIVKFRWFGEASSGWNKVFNIQRDGVRVNEASGLFDVGLSMATLTYGASLDDNTTPEIMTVETLDSSGSTAGTATTFTLIVSDNTTDGTTLWTNRCFAGASGGGIESGVSEIIIMEIAA